MTDTAPILHRELVDIPHTVRAVPEPPAPQLAAPFGVRPVDAGADAAMISEWMNRPHLMQAWESDWPAARWQRYLQAQLDGRYSRPFLIALRGKDHGYIEIYRAAKDSIATRYDADPYDLGLHAAIADLGIVNRGIAPLLLPRIVASLFEREPRCRRVMFDPDHRNTTARRLCEFAGCVFLGEHDMANRRMALYALPRPESNADQLPANNSA